MDREELFEKFIEACEINKQVCGQGEYRANILLIGQEPYCNEEIEGEKLTDYLSNNYSKCRNHSCCYIHESKGQSPTWKNYQKLIDLIYQDKPKNNDILDFEPYAFTTELNSIPRPHKVLDSQTKENIKKRLILFEESRFIQSFPVIILACGDYIRNNIKVREIDDTFHVEFCQEYGSKESKNRFWTHFDDKNDPRKLVIHTRQFSLGYMKPEDREWLIENMAEVIRGHLDHLKKLGLI